MQALCFFMSVIRSLGNHSRHVHTDRCQRKEKRERGYDSCPWQQRGPQGRKAVVGVRWVPAGIHPHPAGVRGCAPLAAGCCYFIALRSCKGKKKPQPVRACTSDQSTSSRGEAKSSQMWQGFTLHSLQPCWSLWAMVTSGEGYRLLKSLRTYHGCSVQLKVFHEKTPRSTKPVHNAF